MKYLNNIIFTVILGGITPLMSQPIKSNILSDATNLSSVARNNDIECTCFSSTTLQKFTVENVDQLRSCKNENGWGLWVIPPKQEINHDNNSPHPPFHHDYGFQVHVYGDNTSSCLVEGDMMVMVPMDVALVCQDLIKSRCSELGFL